MTTFLFIMLVYIFVVFTLAFMGGILRFHYLKYQQRHSSSTTMANNSIDRHIDNPNFSTKIVSIQDFEDMKSKEYSKRL